MACMRMLCPKVVAMRRVILPGTHLAPELNCCFEQELVKKGTGQGRLVSHVLDCVCRRKLLCAVASFQGFNSVAVPCARVCVHVFKVLILRMTKGLVLTDCCLLPKHLPGPHAGASHAHVGRGCLSSCVCAASSIACA